MVRNDGSDNQNSNRDNTPHLVLEADFGTTANSTLIGGQYRASGSDVWAGFSDPDGGDSDEKDFLVRVSVPDVAPRRRASASTMTGRAVRREPPTTPGGSSPC